MKRWLQLAAISLLGGISSSAMGTERPHDVYEYYLWFRSQQGSSMADVAQEIASGRLVRDDKNGWMQIEIRSDTRTFVTWKRPGKGSIVALAWIARDRDEHGPYETYDVTFGEDVDGHLVVREDLVPAIGLRDFWDEARPAPEGKYGMARFEFVLPRKGTSIQVLLRPELLDNLVEPEEPDDGFRYDKYLAGIKAAKYSALELVFDKQAGKFVKGAKTLATKKAGNAP